MNDKSIYFSVRERSGLARLNIARLEDYSIDILYLMVQTGLFSENQKETLSDYLGTLFHGIGTFIDECEKALADKYGEGFHHA